MSTRRIRILMFGYLPPPVFGPSVAYEMLLRSEFPQHFDVTFINLSVVNTIRELETLSPAKLLKLVKFLALEFRYLLTRQFAFCCYPVAFNRNAFLKDTVLLGMARAFGVPTVLWAHGTGLQRFRGTLSPRLQRWLDTTIRETTAVVVLAECLRSDFAGLVPPERIHPVPIGIEPQANLPPPDGNHEGVRILYLGALVKTKGIFDLLAALPLVLARCPAVRLLIAGEWFRAQEQAEAEQFLDHHALRDAVQFLGAVHGAAKWRLLRSTEVLVFPPPAQFEAFGIVLLEAMQAGLPIVATRGGARNEILADGVNALLAEEHNPADLAEKIVRLADDPALRQRMGTANRERFLSTYTHEHYGQRMTAVFELACAEGVRQIAIT